MRKSLFLWLCFFTTNIAFGQQCRDEVLLNTGYNHTTNSLYALGQADGYWQVTQMPNFTGCTNINVPSTSFLVNSSAWATFPQSAWLSYRPDAALSCNNKCGEAQAVTFERKFCMVESDTVQIYMQLKFDNSACVYLDGVLLPMQPKNATGNITFNTIQSTVSPCNLCDNWNDNRSFGLAAAYTEVAFSKALAAGTHTLEVKVRNNSAVLFGFNMIGTIKGTFKAKNNFLCPDDCQKKSGTIAIQKVLDKNCNGKKDDDSENGSNWKFTIKDPKGTTKTLTTDATGWAFLTNITDFGLYTITEEKQSGWTAKSPTNGTISVAIEDGKPYQITFFNCPFKETWCSKPNEDFCPDNLVSNGDFESITANPDNAWDEDINLATDWFKVWGGTSTGDLFCSGGSLFPGYAPTPPSGVYSGIWIENRTSQTTDNVFREGIYNKLKTPITKNSGYYELNFKMAHAKLTTSNPSVIGIYGVYNPNNTAAPTPTGFRNPENVNLWGSSSNVKVVLLGKITTPVTFSNTWLSQTLTFNSNISDFPANGITHLMITAYDDVTPVVYSKQYINFDEFCLKKTNSPAAGVCCPKFESSFGMCEPNNSIKHLNVQFDNLNASSPICSITMSSNPVNSFDKSNLTINGTTSTISWTPILIDLTGKNANTVSFTLSALTKYQGNLNFTVTRCDGTTCEYKQIWESEASPKSTVTLRQTSVDIKQGYRLSGHSIEIIAGIPFVKGYGIIIGFPQNDSLQEFFALSAPQSPYDTDVIANLLPTKNVKMSRKNAIFEIGESLTLKDTLKVNLVLKGKENSETPLRVTILDTDGKILATNTATIKTLANVTSTSITLNNDDGFEDIFELYDPFPNPAQNEVNIKYLIGTESDIRLELYTIEGKLLKTIDKGLKQPALHQINLDITTLNSGNYLLRLSSKKGVVSQKFTVIK